MAENYSYPADEYILLGKITKAHGLTGEVKVFLYSGQPANLKNYKELVLVDGKGLLSPPLRIAESREQGNIAVVRFETVRDRNFAEKIEGMGVLLAHSQLPTPEKDEFYYHLLIGKQVVDADGSLIGKIENIFSNGAQEILVVTRDSEEFYIPLIKEIIIAENAGGLVIQPPPGLLDINRDTGN